jgi:mono/diheme cytochrome c family protein
MKSKFSIAMIVMSVVFLIGTAFQSGQPWAVPDKNAKAVNPVKTSPTSIAAGKALYIKHCQECHGKKGLGDGTKVADLKTTPPDMTKASFQAQTDGAIFYKMSEGRSDMPRAKKELPDDEDRWNLVNYLRTFKK